MLQKITGGFWHGMFTYLTEEKLRRVIHHEALFRAGLPWPPQWGKGIKYWSRDKKQQDRNRQIYHGLRRRSLHIINQLVGVALQEAADPVALKVARRFPFYYRELIYRAGAKSRRALQLAEAFPVLAVAVYCPGVIPYYRENQYYGAAARQAAVQYGAPCQLIGQSSTSSAPLQKWNPSV